MYGLEEEKINPSVIAEKLFKSSLLCLILATVVEPEPHGAETFGRSRSRNEVSAPAPGQNGKFINLFYYLNKYSIRIHKNVQDKTRT